MIGQGWPWNCFEVACFEILRFITLVVIALFQTEESLYCGIKNARPTKSERALRVLQNHEVWCKPGQC